LSDGYDLIFDRESLVSFWKVTKWLAYTLLAALASAATWVLKDQLSARPSPGLVPLVGVTEAIRR
jgi:hypothetical protein